MLTRKVGIAQVIAALTPGLWPHFALAAKPGEAVGAGSLLQLAFGLIVVLGAIAFGAYLLRRLGKFSAPVGGAMRILGGVSLGARERVVLMQVGDQQLLLGVAPGRVQTLHVLERPIVEAANAPVVGGGGSFADRLAGLMKR
jgi:flagellar protein FliO/FliZ